MRKGYWKFSPTPIVDTAIGSDRLFETLEELSEKHKKIVVTGAMKDFLTEQVLMRFVDRYKYLIASYHVDMDVSVGGRACIIFREKRENPGKLGYSKLVSSYTKTYYMNDCGGYEVFKQSNGMMLDNRLGTTYTLVNPQSGERILDVGCGRGELTYALSRTGANVVGIDYSKDAIQIATSTYPLEDNCQFICNDIFKMSNSDTFDKIVMADIVEHIEQDILEEIFFKIASLLRPHGVLVIHTAPNRDYYEYTYPKEKERAALCGLYLPKEPRTYYEQCMHINEQTPEKLETALQKYFKFVKVWTGDIQSIDKEKTTEERRWDNEIYALASHTNSVLSDCIGVIVKHPNMDTCKAEIEGPDSIEVSLGRDYIDLDLTVKNVGQESFSSFVKYPINLCYHIYEGEDLLVFDGERTAIVPSIKPGEKRAIKMRVKIPKQLQEGKTYRILCTLVAEFHFWFDQNGENLKNINLTITR